MSARAPISYQVPSFPSLYLPQPRTHHEAYYLYYTSDIWRFTLFWTMILFGGTHLCVAICAAAMQCRSWKVICAVPVLYLVVGALEALLSGSIIGLVLGVVYEAGNFRMSTWLPLIWGGVNVTALILSSFPMQGGL